MYKPPRRIVVVDVQTESGTLTEVDDQLVETGPVQITRNHELRTQAMQPGPRRIVVVDVQTESGTLTKVDDQLV
jgi:hypothetical protein